MEESSSLASSFRPPTADDFIPAAASYPSWPPYGGFSWACGNLNFQIPDPADDDSVPVPPTADNSVPSRYPSWVLLDKRAHLAHHESATTKKVKTCTGQEVEISFCVAKPPDVSHFCVHSPQISGEDYTFEPSVVSSDGNLVLLRFAFKTAPQSTDVDSDLVEFFVCKAGSGGNLSIEPIPYSPAGNRLSCHAGIVPCDGGNFLVADLFLPRKNSEHYDLHVFSSETNKWTTTYLQLRTPTLLPQDLPSQLDKVISLKGSVVGWVDLWRGILFCDVLDKEPVLTFTPLPTTAFNLHRKGQAQKVRDVTCCNGFISFVEIEHCFREVNIDNRKSFKMTQNLDTEDSILVNECLVHDDLEYVPDLVPDGWKIRTMFKDISWDYWKKRYTVHSDEISAMPEKSMLLPQGWKCRAMKTTDFTFFRFCRDNVVYFIHKVEFDDKHSWIVGVDLEKKKVDSVKPYCADSTVLPCAFAEYMNATQRPSGELVAASFSQSGVLNNHLPLGDTVLNNAQPQQNTLNADGYYRSWNGSGYGAHSGYDNYQQPTPWQPQYVVSPYLQPIVQPMSTRTRSGYIFARWSDPDVNGKMSMIVPLNDMRRLDAALLAPSTPPMPVHPLFAQGPSPTFPPQMT